MRVGELLIARHQAVGDGPDVHEPGLHRTLRAAPVMPAQRHDPGLVQRQDLVRGGGESLDKQQLETQRKMNERLGKLLDLYQAPSVVAVE